MSVVQQVDSGLIGGVIRSEVASLFTTAHGGSPSRPSICPNCLLLSRVDPVRIDTAPENARQWTASPSQPLQVKTATGIASHTTAVVREARHI
jgi:hypothetical protein